ncbi:MAG: GGDEF domain-containing protein [Chloroflexi bacterium]|nr:GGDEF domain-containing protein [Chloroflexota bacterium]MBV9892738.1 GGDEF domain-containing protein [Chloroflexota bacterium]
MLGLQAFRSLPTPARLWWLSVVLLSVALVPACLSQGEVGLPIGVLVLAALLNAGVVVATKPRHRQASFVVSFDYGGIATVAMLAAFGPQAALCTFVGEKVARALTPEVSGRRPAWVRAVYNLAWGCPCILFSWWTRGLAPDVRLEPAVIAIAWWLSNGVLVGTMVALAGRRSPREALRVAVVEEGWLRLQEGALSVLAVVAWWTHPLLLIVVVLLVTGHAMTGRRLFGEYERSAAASEQALAERRRAEVEAEQARLDPLTRLANRRAYQEAVDEQPAPAAALVMDLDHFKRVNDTFGHDVGDRVLVEVAGVLRRTLEPIALCSRLGGEEFCALIAQCPDDEELFRIADYVRRAVSDLRFEGYPTLQPTASVGAARRLAHELTVHNAVSRADQALYAAKREGRNRTIIAPKATPLPRAS